MLLKMFVHSAAFTVAIAFGAVVLNGAGMLDNNKQSKSWGYSSGYTSNSAFWAKDDDDHDKWKRKGHDDD